MKDDAYDIRDTKLEEDSTFDKITFKVFKDEFEKLKLDVDLHFMNEKKISEIPPFVIQSFNECLLDVKLKYSFLIFDILTQLSIYIIEPSKIKSLINDTIKYELIDELKMKHSTIKQMYPITDQLF